MFYRPILVCIASKEEEAVASANAAILAAEKDDEVSEETHPFLLY